MKLIFLGPPGAGKGTQAKIISEKISVPHISTGDIFRMNIKNSTELGKKASEFMNKGLLVPDSVTNSMVENRLKDSDCRKGFILDGYPRTLLQAEFLDSKVMVDKVINFKLGDKEIIRRISGRRTCKNCGTPYHIIYMKPKVEGMCDKCNLPLVQRDDEKPDVVKKRLEVYKSQTQPLISYYSKQCKLADVDAMPAIDAVTKKVYDLVQ